MSTKRATHNSDALSCATTARSRYRPRFGGLHIDKGDEIEFRMAETGEVVVRGMTVVPAEQRWFWSEDWQAGEREASAQISHGEISTHDDVDAFFTDLKS